MTYPEYVEQEFEEQPDDVATAPAPVVSAMVSPMNWSASTLLWIAGGVLAAGFAVWFLMSYSKAKAAHVASLLEGSGDGSGAGA